MGPHLVRLFLLAAAGLVPSLPAAAADPVPVDACAVPPRYGVEATAAAIVRVACAEHRLWLQPFIDRDGRLASLAVTEAERSRLDDGSTPAWQRVARYWRESGTLAAMAAAPGAESCLPPHGERFRDNDCRAFLLDNPWSAAFVSWVMLRAGAPGFAASPRHMDYIIHAWREPDRSPFRYADPFVEKPAPGDMLCFLRAADEGRGVEGLRAALSGNGHLPRQSHCEVVIAANPGGDRTVHLVGGNVLNAVVMRQLPLDRSGRLQAGSVGPLLAAAAPSSPADRTLPEDAPAAYGCSPGLPAGCDFNRRDWAVLLKLRPQAQLGPAPSGAPAAASPAAQGAVPAPAAAPAVPPQSPALSPPPRE